MGDFDRPQNEDCLSLTICTPAPDGKARPVLVWLHGGAWISGAGSLDWYDGARLASEGDIVEPIGRQPLNQLRQCVHDQTCFELHADYSGGRRENMLHRHVKLLRDGIAASKRHPIARSRGAIGIARIDEHGANQPARLGHVKARDPDRSGLYAILGEDGGRGCRRGNLG